MIIVGTDFQRDGTLAIAKLTGAVNLAGLIDDLSANDPFTHAAVGTATPPSTSRFRTTSRTMPVEPAGPREGKSGQPPSAAATSAEKVIMPALVRRLASTPTSGRTCGERDA